MKAARQSNIELLRILTMFAVIVLHYNGGNGNALDFVRTGSVNYWILMIAESLCICAVNVFMLISGYFSCTSQRRDPIKVLELLIQVIAFQAGLYLLGALYNKSFSLSSLFRSLIPANYFVVLYIVVYLISPYVNILLGNLDKKQLRKFVMLSFLLFSVFPTATDLMEAVTQKTFPGINTIGLDGDSNGYTIVNFLLMYILGAYLRLAPTERKPLPLLAVSILCVGIILILNLCYPHIARAYCNPAVIILAICIFELFQKLSFQSKIVNNLSKAAFTVYLFHSYPLGKLNVAKAVAANPFYLVLHILLSSIGIFLLSWILYFIYEKSTKPFFLLVRKLIFSKRQ